MKVNKNKIDAISVPEEMKEQCHTQCLEPVSTRYIHYYTSIIKTIFPSDATRIKTMSSALCRNILLCLSSPRNYLSSGISLQLHGHRILTVVLRHET
jgi:hypothetical protein